MPVKKPVRKATPDKAAKRKDKVERKAPASSTNVEDVIAAVNRELKSDVVRRANEMETLYLLRRPTGITSLDIALAGGFPASSSNVLVGPDGAGKDLLLWMQCAEVQKIYGDDFRMVAFFTEFKPDKPFMRNMCGLKIAFSAEELDDYDETRQKSGLPALTDEERAELRVEIGKIYVIDGVTAEQGFDAIIRIIGSNHCQLVVINSIGNLQTEAKDALESFEEFARQASEATLLSAFMPKLSMTLNNDRNGRNETTLMIINQMRAKRDAQPVRGRPTQERDKYEPGAKAFALKHGKAIELTIHKGAKYRDEVEKVITGRKVPWQITKGKLGTHDGIEGEFDFYYEGGVDKIGDLYTCCTRYEVVDQAGAWLNYDHPEFGFHVQGKEGMRRKLREEPGLYDHLRLECFRAAGVVCRFR